MGAALVGGLLDAGWDAASVVVAEVDPERRRALEQSGRGVRVVPSSAWAVADAEVVVVAVKPADVAGALEQAAPSLGERTLVMSIAAGVTIARLEAAAPGRPVVRAMPNTPALIGRAATAIAAGRLADDSHLALAERVLGSVGTVVRVPESQLDAVTAVSGSGPAYLFLLAEAMVEGGVAAGLPRSIADALVRQTLAGSSELLAAGESPEILRAGVTSPGGTTAAALHVLEQHGFRGAILDAVRAAAERSRELGRA
jgi:pyrroline-5-carboxylate reductase